MGECHTSLDLKRPIVFFDLETTGVDTEKDRIVQLAAVRFEPDGQRTEINQLVNPGRPIPAEATEVHHITDAQVAAKPKFAEVVDIVASFFDGADLGGFNIVKFDVPMLQNEFERCGRSLDLTVAMVDACQVFFKREPRDLEGALQFYCGQEHENAHDALSDVEATIQVLNGQLEAYPTMARTSQGVYDETRDPDAIDLAGKLKWNGDQVELTFGKHKGTPLRKVPRSYLDWAYNNGVFGPDAKDLVKKAMCGSYPGRKEG